MPVLGNRYPFVEIAFDKILAEDFDQAIGEHIAGPNVSARWGRLATPSPAMQRLAVGLATVHQIKPAVAAGLFLAGMNAGFILSEHMKGRVISIVDGS